MATVSELERAIEAEDPAVTAARAEGIERAMAPIRADIESLPAGRERERFVDTPLWDLFRRDRALLRRAAERARRTASRPAVCARSGSRPRESRRRSFRTAASGRGDPSSDSDEPPLPELARTAAASARMVARIARRERRRFSYRPGEAVA